MKKILSLVLLGLMTIFAACQKEELDVPDGSAAQKFTVTIPSNGVPSRAVADNFSEGTLVNRCILEIYRGDALYSRIEKGVTGGTVTFDDLRLVASQTYDFVFWADCADGNETEGFTDKVYVTENGLTNITEKGAFAGNSDDRDAFYFCLPDKEVTGTFSELVTLTRPFGLLVVKTSDLSAINDSNLIPDGYGIAFKGLPNAFNARTGAVSGSADVSYRATEFAKADGTVSMDFLWASPEKAALADFSMTFYKGDVPITTNDNFKNIPIRRNYKTNVSGNLLTKKGTINVTIDAQFTDEYDETITEVATIEEANAALAEGKTNIVVVEAPAAAAELTIAKVHATTDTEVSVSLPATTQTVTVKYDGGNGNTPASVNISIPSSENLVIDLPNSTVTLNGQTYNAVTATTAENTLIVPEGVTVGSLTVKGGNVEIYGKVGTIDFQNGTSVIKVYSVANAETFRKAVELANTGKCEKIVLAGNLELDGSAMNITGTLALNEKTLTFNNATGAVEVPEGASLTVTGGTIKVSRSNTAQASLLVNKDASLVLESVLFETNAAALFPAGDAASVVVRNSTVTAKTYAVATNASTTYTVGILLENSSFTGSSPILVNIPCELAMNGCIVTGSMHGVVVRGGTARINGCDITLEYNDSYYEEMAAYFNDRNWGQGNMVNLAAMTIGNKHATSYQYPTDVALVNTSLRLGGQYGSHFPALYAYANQGEGLGVTLAYDATCRFDKAPVIGSENIVVNNAYNPWDGQSTDEITPNAAGEYEVATPAQLAWIAATVNSGEEFEGKTVKLMADIDLAGHAWTPIGDGSRLGSAAMGNQFKGTFDGNGRTISNLNINTTKGTDFAVGLFGVVNGGTVKNLKFGKVSVDVPTSEMAAAAVGMLTGGGTVSGVEVLSGHVAAVRGNGAIVGRMIKGGTISGCNNYAAVTGTGANVGGIVGAAYYTAEGQTMTIEACGNYGTVTGTAGAVGGIVGLSAANVSNCTNEADIKGNGADVAGIVAEQQNAGSVTDCTNRGAVVNTSSAYGTGGIVGWVRYNGTTANYPVKNVISVTGNMNYGAVSGGNDAGGIIGTVYNLGKINDNKNFAETLSSGNFTAGIVGNAQFTETAIGMTEPNSVEVKNNVSTTPLESITGSCKDLYVYINSQEFVTAENNRNAE